MNRTHISLGLAALAMAAAMYAQTPPAAKLPGKKSVPNGSAMRGKVLFEQKCAVCHNAYNNVKKFEPGLKGISKRETFTINNNKVTDQTLKTWIENGDTLMPPFKDVLELDQIKDVVAFVKTL